MRAISVTTDSLHKRDSHNSKKDAYKMDLEPIEYNMVADDSLSHLYGGALVVTARGDTLYIRCIPSVETICRQRASLRLIRRLRPSRLVFAQKGISYPYQLYGFSSLLQQQLQQSASRRSQAQFRQRFQLCSASSRSYC